MTNHFCKVTSSAINNLNGFWGLKSHPRAFAFLYHTVVRNRHYPTVWEMRYRPCAEVNTTHLISCSSLSVAILNLLSSSRVRSSSAWLLTALSRSRLSSSHWRRILSRSCTILSRSLNAQSRRFILIVASFFASDEEKKNNKKGSMRGYCIWWCKPTCVWFFNFKNNLSNIKDK